jgi:hypothetical protein
MKQKLRYALKLTAIILFVRPSLWKYEIEKLKKEQN